MVDAKLGDPQTAFGVTGSSITAPATVYGVLLDADARTLRFQSDGADNSDGGSGLFTMQLPPTGILHAMAGTNGYNELDVTANFGASAFTYAPPAGYTAGLGADSATGAQTATASGAAAFSAGAPLALPYINQTAQHQGTPCFAAGYPSCVYNPVAGADQIALGVGVRAFASGAPTVGARAATTAGGTLVFGGGAPAAVRAARAAGFSVFTPGAPRTTAAARGVGAPAFGSWRASLKSTAIAHGRSLARCGTPRAAASAFRSGAAGAVTFAAGTPLVAGMTSRARPAAVFRAGTPAAGGSAVC